MRDYRSSRPRLGLLLVVLAATWVAPKAAQAKRFSSTVPRAEGAEFARIEGELGYVSFRDRRVVFSKPYSRKTVERMLAKVRNQELHAQVRGAYLRLLTQVVQFSEIPQSDVKKLVHPALVEVVKKLEELAERDPAGRNVVRLLTQARRCLWNADYALALAEIDRLAKVGKDPSDSPAQAEMERLEKTAVERTKTTGTYMGDLVSWYLRRDTEAARKKIAELAKVDKNNWRICLAQEELRVRRALKKCENDDERAQLLMDAAITRDSPKALQGWAVRTLVKYPTEAAVKFLFEIFETARKTKRHDLGLEAQEALKRLKKIPQGVHRHTPM